MSYDEITENSFQYLEQIFFGVIETTVRYEKAILYLEFAFYIFYVNFCSVDAFRNTGKAFFCLNCHYFQAR